MPRPSPSTLALSLTALFLAACATPRPSNSVKVIPPATFKVHPGLLGQPVPPELERLAGGTGAGGTGAGGAAGTGGSAGTDGVAEAGGSAGKAGLQMDEEGLRTQRSVYFDFDQYDIKPDFNPALAAHGRYLAKHPQARVRVEGNADERGSSHYNRVLGMRRALAVKNALLANGASDKQVKTITLGDSRPKLKGKDEASWAENRRADVVYEVEK
ncbi:MAG: OmpA family protein [Azovibrio sp.]|uniref:OmpA family protein n=1 Tax=Azovibrio sp. TaxID=1872673 RepID=UPI003C716789